MTDTAGPLRVAMPTPKPSANDTALAPAALGNRLRALRRKRHLTLEQLAGATGLNRGYLSRLENGEKSPSIATTLKLAKALEVATAALFGEAVEETDLHLVRVANQVAAKGPVESGGYQLVPLSHGSSTAGLVAFLLHPSDQFEEDGRAEHAGTEGVYVLQGEIEMRLADRSICLSEGDYLQLPGHVSHQIRKLGKLASVLVVIGRD